MNENYTIIDFLKEHYVEKGGVSTHTSMGKPLGSYYISDEELDTFHELYDKYNENVTNDTLALIERHKEYSPMVIDIDEKYSNEITERQHTKEHCKKIVSLYVDEIVKIFKIKKSDERLVAFVFEKPGIYESRGIKKDGLHIIFPFIISEPNPQYFIRNNILKKIPDIITDLKLTNKPSDLVDNRVIYSNGWFLFGSTKPKQKIYDLVYIYNGKMKEIDINNYSFPKHSSLSKFFSIRYCKEKDIIPLRDSYVEIVDNYGKKKSNKLKSKRRRRKLNIVNPEEIGKLVDILSVDRADNEPNWMEVGWALHNIDPENEDYLNMWISFSQKSEKFVEGECEKKWEKMKDNGLGIGSIYFWAKIDNYVKYQEIRRSNIQGIIEETINNGINNYDIARVLHEMFKYDFVCSSAKNKVWYEYKDHRWQEMDADMALRKKYQRNYILNIVGFYLNIIKNHQLMILMMLIKKLQKKLEKKFMI